MSTTRATLSHSEGNRLLDLFMVATMTLLTSIVLFIITGIACMTIETNSHANLYSELEQARWSLTLPEMNSHLDNVLAHLESRGLSNAPTDFFNSENEIAKKYLLLRQIREESAKGISQLDFVTLRDTLQPDHYRISAEWYDVSHGFWGILLLLLAGTGVGSFLILVFFGFKA